MSGFAPLVRDVVRRLLLVAARDVTSVASGRSLLVVAPHPDDETLGCGARILAATAAGAPVTVLVLTRGEGSHPEDFDTDTLVRVRRDELLEAMARLGVPESAVVQLDHPDGHLDQHEAELTEAVRQLVDSLCPDDVCVTAADEPHPDHATASRAVRRALSLAAHQPRLLEYPVWLWSTWPLSRQHGPTTVVRALLLAASRRVERVSVAPVRDLKRAALEAYASQLGSASPVDAVAGTHPSSVALPRKVVARAVDDPELFFRVARP